MKRIDAKEFRSLGYLQELNRLFLHPLGMALEVIVDEETGQEVFGGVWDCRDEPGGLVFDNVDPGKAKYVLLEQLAAAAPRRDALGFVVQPVGDLNDVTILQENTSSRDSRDQR